MLLFRLSSSRKTRLHVFPFTFVLLNTLLLPVNAFVRSHPNSLNNNIFGNKNNRRNSIQATTALLSQRRVKFFSVKNTPWQFSVANNNPSFWFVRIALLRSLGLVYMVAFLIALHQNKALIGTNGITPASLVLDSAESRAKMKQQRRLQWEEEKQQYSYTNSSPINRITRKIRNSVLYEMFQKQLIEPFYRYFWDRTDSLGRPLVTLLWLGYDEKNHNKNNNSKMDSQLDLIAYLGLALACIIFTKGAANVPMLGMLWLCQRSIMSVGGPWYGFGWETLLAEMTFHLLFMVPVVQLTALPIHTPVPISTIYALRWLLFRVMMGSGLIKLRSNDDKWKTLTAMNYFYETMPVPNMWSRYFHRMPETFHKFETISNHLIELVLPWLLIIPCPKKWRIQSAVLQIIFQFIIIACGNFSFLNWLTMIPALACMDDDALSFLFPRKKTSAFTTTYTFLREFGDNIHVSSIRKIVNFIFSISIIKLSVPVVKNLLSKKQKMNSSFDKLRLVNTYGAFGVVNEERIELVVEAATSIQGPWKEYSFKVKPGDLTRTPRWISPYHYRLDWQMWIASTVGIDRSPWMYNFLLKLLEEDKQVLNLLDGAPDLTKPKYIRVEKYRYKFATPTRNEEQSTKNETKSYWNREYVGRFFPRQGILTHEMLKDLVIETQRNK